MKTIKYNLLKIGDLFSIDLKNGHYGLGWVINNSRAKGTERIYGQNTPVFAALDYYSTTRPTLDIFSSKNFLDKLFSHNHVPKILRQTSFSWNNQPCAIYVVKHRFKQDSENFSLLGNIQPTKLQQNIKCTSISSLDFIATMIIQEWRWKHDKENLVKEQEQKIIDLKQKLKDEASEEEGWLKKATLEDLLETNYFPDWKRMWGKKIEEEAKNICQKTVDQLLKPNLNSAVKQKILKNFILDFNKLNKQNNDFFETVEREDIYDFFRKTCVIIKFPNTDQFFEKHKNF